MHEGHFWHKVETGTRRKYSLFAKIGNRWKRVSAITCRDKRESEVFFRGTLAKSDVFGLKVQVRPV
ncbi:hypothetical protein LCGC14_2096800 [marine sediment metagenome]|uniref:Uncharacterized protein n=1 Tax=marine sediment metagenome TaxID=412755 RepID=A0A0F9GPE1_9ZZZZ